MIVGVRDSVLRCRKRQVLCFAQDDCIDRSDLHSAGGLAFVFAAFVFDRVGDDEEADAGYVEGFGGH